MIAPVTVGYVLDQDGRTPIPSDDIEAVAKLISDYPARKVDRTNGVIPGIDVSTVFMPDLGLSSDGSIHFESRVEGGSQHGVQFRYPTWALAEEGHARLCRIIRENPDSFT